MAVDLRGDVTYSAVFASGKWILCVRDYTIIVDCWPTDACDVVRIWLYTYQGVSQGLHPFYERYIRDLELRV